MIYIIKNENRRKEKVNHVIEVVKKSGGISYSQQKMEEYRDKALALLYEFETTEVRQTLEELVRYTTDENIKLAYHNLILMQKRWKILTRPLKKR